MAVCSNGGVFGDTVNLGARLEGGVEVFNLTNRQNDLTRNTNFGPGSYPGNPLPTFNQITGVGEPRSMQVVIRVSF